MRQRGALHAPPPPPQANDGVALIGAAQLAEVIRTAVTEALEAQGPVVAKKVLNRVELARALSCSPTQIDKLRRAGLPHLRVGDSPRFDLDECITWLRNRKDEKA